jgi:hypothetical protein
MDGRSVHPSSDRHHQMIRSLSNKIWIKSDEFRSHGERQLHGDYAHLVNRTIPLGVRKHKGHDESNPTSEQLHACLEGWKKCYWEVRQNHVLSRSAYMQ